MMSGSTILFYLLAALIVCCGVLSVLTRQIFRAAIYVLFTLIGIAGLYFWLQYEFLAAVQIVVYVGGIIVLIIFSIFLTQQAGDKLAKQHINRKIFAGLSVFCGFALTIVQVLEHGFKMGTEDPILPTVENIGHRMLDVNNSGYAFPFEIVSILLLAALVGCIVIALRTKPESEVNQK